ncbi:hypothetical protein T03_18196 [Trichinella britovi]|uniref:Uncharacterized protein n=1 Tax=Trichinella britovi TaxID=45882 RepID=A0A0V1D0C9_TRIBR|nr:hypothetical protein T03_18196 [Trichinella britovi]
MKYLSKKTLNLTVKVKNLATFSLIGKDMNNTLKLVYETFSASFKNNFHPKALPMLRVTIQCSGKKGCVYQRDIIFLARNVLRQVQARRNTHLQMYMFLSHIEYLLECNTLAVNRIKVTEYKKTRIPLTGTKNVATKLALDGPFVYGQHLMILALD